MIRIVNSWKAKNKQVDKFRLYIRISTLTVLDINWDVSSGEWKVLFMNYGFRNG